MCFLGVLCVFFWCLEESKNSKKMCSFLGLKVPRAFIALVHFSRQRPLKGNRP